MASVFAGLDSGAFVRRPTLAALVMLVLPARDDSLLAADVEIEPFCPAQLPYWQVAGLLKCLQTDADAGPDGVDVAVVLAVLAVPVEGVLLPLLFVLLPPPPFSSVG